MDIFFVPNWMYRISIMLYRDGFVPNTISPVRTAFDMLHGSVSVPPIAVAYAAPVYSRMILYEVNSLYSVTLYCCDPSLCCTL